MVGGTILGFDRSEYIRLVVQFPPVKIRTAEQAKATESRIEVLLEQPNLSQAEDSYVDLLSDLLADWEDATVTIPDIDGVELRRALLEDRGLRQEDLVGVFATESVASEVIAGRRELSRQTYRGTGHLSDAVAQLERRKPGLIAPANFASRRSSDARKSDKSDIVGR